MFYYFCLLKFKFFIHVTCSYPREGFVVAKCNDNTVQKKVILLILHWDFRIFLYIFFWPVELYCTCLMAVVLVTRVAFFITECLYSSDSQSLYLSKPPTQHLHICYFYSILFTFLLITTVVLSHNNLIFQFLLRRELFLYAFILYDQTGHGLCCSIRLDRGPEDAHTLRFKGEVLEQPGLSLFSSIPPPGMVKKLSRIHLSVAVS